MTNFFFEIPLDAMFILLTATVIVTGIIIANKIDSMKWVLIQFYTQSMDKADKWEKKLSSKIKEIKNIVEQEEKQFRTSEELVADVAEKRAQSEQAWSLFDNMILQDMPLPRKRQWRPKWKPHPRRGMYTVDLSNPWLKLTPSNKMMVENSLLYIQAQIDKGLMTTSKVARELVWLYRIVHKGTAKPEITAHNIKIRLGRWMTIEQAICTPANGRKVS